jgi:capsid protein
VAYHIKNSHPLSCNFTASGTAQEWTRIEAFGKKTGRRNVIHVMNRERIGQRRGVPFLSPVIEALKQLGRYTDAELVAAVVNGMFAVFIEKGENSGDGAAVGSVIPENEQVDSSDNNSIEIGNGSIIDLDRKPRQT